LTEYILISVRVTCGLAVLSDSLQHCC